MGAAFGLGIDQRKSGQAAGRDRRRQGVGEQVGTRTLAQHRDHLRRSADEPAGRAAERLAQRAADQIDPIGQTEIVAGTATARA